VHVLVVDLLVHELAVLEELLAVVGRDDHGHAVAEAERGQAGEEVLHDVVRVVDLRVVEGLVVLDGPRGECPSSLVEGEQVGADRLEHSRRRRPLPVERAVRLRRVVGVVDGVGVQEEEEGLGRAHLPQEVEAAPERPLHGIGRLEEPSLALHERARVAPLLEPSGEAVAPLDVSAFDVAGGAEAVGAQHLRQRADARREHRVRRVDAVLGRIEAGEDRHMRGERPRELRDRVLEERPSGGQRVEEGARGPRVAVGPEVVRAQRVE
jgi:hypothetical protein